MVQKSILSFFAAAKAKKPENESESSSQSEDKDAKSAKSKSSRDDDSPVKKSSRGRARVIESDSEDEAQPSTSSSPSKSDEEKENKQKNSPEVKSKKGTPGKGKKGKAVEESPKVKKNKAEEEKMEVDDQKEEIVANGDARKDEAEETTEITSSPSGSSSAETPKKRGSSKTIGFSPETVPPLRKTARKQMKRKSDSMESKQLEVVKKLKKEEKKDEESEEKGASSQGTPDTKESEEDTEEQETKKETKENDSETEVKKEETKGEEEPMEVDCPQENKKEVKGEKVKSSTPSAKKPIHSFFAPRSPKKSVSKAASTSPKKSDGDKEEEEEEHGSSPIKKQKPAATRRRNVIDSDSEDETAEDQKDKDTEDQKEESSKDQAKESSKSPGRDDSASKKTKGRTPKTEKKTVKSSPKTSGKSPKTSGKSPKTSGKSPKISSKSPKTDIKSDGSEKADTKANKSEKADEKVDKSEKTDAKPEKKPVVNPFAPKSAGSGDPGEKYNPGKEKYEPVKDAFWEHGSKVPYLALAKTFELIEKTSGRLKTIEILANFLRSVIVLSPDDLLQCVYLCLNKVAPAFEGVELGVGDMILMRAIAQSSGRSVDKIKSDAEERGDLGIVAEHSRSNQKLMFQPAKLNVRGVFDKLKEIALMSGNAIQSKKMEKIKGMFVACRFSEARFLIRSLGGKLRIGLAEQSVLHAIAQACYLTPPGQDFPPEVLNAGKGLGPDKLKAEIDNYGLILKTTYCEFPSYDKIIDVLMKEGLEKLPEHCKLTPGIPLKPMLAHPTSGVTEVLKRFENAKFTCEFKYDGERAQIHLKEDGSIRIYSRNQEDNTTKYPDIINRFKNALGENVKSCVIDSEAVAWDQEKKQILPFQILSTRKRKDANEKEIKVQVCVFPFDLLYLNGEALVREPFEKRRSLLKENFNEVEGEFIFAKSMDSTNTEDIEEFLEESIKGNCEGLMVKTLDVDATYEIAKRSHNWLKLKKDYLDGVGDTIDAVVIGSYWGKGKRKGNYGCFLLACYDPDNEEFQSLCKIGTGFTDEQLQTHTTFLKEHVIEKPKSYYRYDSSHEPDCWFEAVQVWEVKCADLSISPHHKAASGVVDPEKGISLRFPRFMRIRDDKTPENATSSSQIADLYNSQAQIQNKNSNKAVEEDFY